MTEFIERVACPVCGDEGASELYRAEKRTGTFLRTVEVVLSQCATCGFVFNSPRPTPAASWWFTRVRGRACAAEAINCLPICTATRTRY